MRKQTLKKTPLRAATSGRESVEAGTQLKSFIAKFGPRHQNLIRAVRKALRKRLPTAYELAYDNYNFFVIGYSPTGRRRCEPAGAASSSSGPFRRSNGRGASL